MARLQRSEVAPQTGSPKAINIFKALRANGICQEKKNKTKVHQLCVPIYALKIRYPCGLLSMWAE